MLDREDIQLLSQIIENQEELIAKLEVEFKGNNPSKVSKARDEILKNQTKISQILR